MGVSVLLCVSSCFNEGSIHTLFETLGKTRVQDAQASVESDRLAFAILARVESEVGYQGLNKQVNDMMHEWMLTVLSELAETTESTNIRIGVIFEENGGHDKAMKLHNNALSICLASFGKDHEFTATTCNNIGNVLYSKGDNKHALAKYQLSLAIQESVLGHNLFWKREDLEDALANYQQALDIYESAMFWAETTLKLLVYTTISELFSLIRVTMKWPSEGMSKLSRYMSRFLAPIALWLPVSTTILVLS